MSAMKLIIPVAGLGTRLAPLTRFATKELLPVGERPVIHHVVEEALRSGAREIILVVSRKNEAKLKKYFRGAKSTDPAIKKSGVKFKFVRQHKPAGFGDAVYRGKKFLEKNEAVMMAVGDEILVQRQPIMSKLKFWHDKLQKPVFALCRVPRKLIPLYGIASVKKSKADKDLYEITDVVEKPPIEKAKSDFTILGRYILTPEIFKALGKTVKMKRAGKIKEAGVTDALRAYLREGGRLYGYEYKGGRYDCGSKEGLLKAQIRFGQARIYAD